MKFSLRATALSALVIANLVSYDAQGYETAGTCGGTPIVAPGGGLTYSISNSITGLTILTRFCVCSFRSDMSSLTDTAKGAQPMNLHSRVIQSGLDSITGPETDSILRLFSACKRIYLHYFETNLDCDACFAGCIFPEGEKN